MKPMDASIAEADIFDVLVASDGALWVRRKDRWYYVIEDGFGYDSRDRLPVEYEPYYPLDEIAAALVLKAVKSYR